MPSAGFPTRKRKHGELSEGCKSPSPSSSAPHPDQASKHPPSSPSPHPHQSSRPLPFSTSHPELPSQQYLPGLPGTEPPKDHTTLKAEAQQPSRHAHSSPALQSDQPRRPCFPGFPRTEALPKVDTPFEAEVEQPSIPPPSSPTPNPHQSPRQHSTGLPNTEIRTKDPTAVEVEAQQPVLDWEPVIRQVDQPKFHPTSPRAVSPSSNPHSALRGINTAVDFQRQPFVESWLDKSITGDTSDQRLSTTSLPPSPPLHGDPDPGPAEYYISHSPAAPLTKKNLRAYKTGTVASTSSAKGQGSSKSKNPLRLRNKLEILHMIPHQRDDAIPFAEIIKKARAIIDKPRPGTIMSDSSATKAGNTFERNSLQGETTFLVNFLHSRIIKLNRRIPASGTEEQVVREWEDDGILGVWDRPFDSDCMGNLIDAKDRNKESFDPTIATEACSIPKPDICYGLMRSVFGEVERKLMDFWIDLFEVCKGLIWVFFFVEGKSYLQNIIFADIQTQRGGAGLLCAHRQIYQLLGLSEDKDGVDYLSRVFSLCVDNDHGWLNIHWITYEGDGESRRLRYRQHRIKHYNFQVTADLAEMRHDIWNIMDWGYTEHKKNVTKALEKMKMLLDPAALWRKETQAAKKRKAAEMDSGS